MKTYKIELINGKWTLNGTTYKNLNFTEKKIFEEHFKGFR